METIASINQLQKDRSFVLRSSFPFSLFVFQKADGKTIASFFVSFPQQHSFLSSCAPEVRQSGLRNGRVVFTHSSFWSSFRSSSAREASMITFLARGRSAPGF